MVKICLHKFFKINRRLLCAKLTARRRRNKPGIVRSQSKIDRLLAKLFLLFPTKPHLCGSPEMYAFGHAPSTEKHCAWGSVCTFCTLFS